MIHLLYQVEVPLKLPGGQMKKYEIDSTVWNQITFAELFEVIAPEVLERLTDENKTQKCFVSAIPKYVGYVILCPTIRDPNSFLVFTYEELISPRRKKRNKLQEFWKKVYPTLEYAIREVDRLATIRYLNEEFKKSSKNDAV